MDKALSVAELLLVALIGYGAYKALSATGEAVKKAAGATADAVALAANPIDKDASYKAVVDAGTDVVVANLTAKNDLQPTADANPGYYVKKDVDQSQLDQFYKPDLNYDDYDPSKQLPSVNGVDEGV